MITQRNTFPIVACFLVCGLSSQLLLSQGHVDWELTVSAVANPHDNPTVSTLAKAQLIGGDGDPLVSQIIAGHKLTDITIPAKLAEHRYVSEPGASSTGGIIFTEGIYLHCYQADFAVHVNEFNFHPMFQEGPECAEPPQPRPKPEIPDENSPVLLDLDQDGFHLSGSQPAVRFDIDADGTMDDIAWTKAGEDDAFLCWDRNGNGVIDNGHELFGYATQLRSGEPAVVGYLALAELDQREAGGNLDAIVDASDQAFHTLCAWVDTNRDGVSQSDELRGLDEVGILSLEYDYRTTRLKDSFGNLFRYASSAKMRTPSGSVRAWPTFDVIFAEGIQESLGGTALHP